MQLRGVSSHVDGNDTAASDGKRDYTAKLAANHDHCSGSAVDQRGPGVRRKLGTPSQDLPCDGLSAGHGWTRGSGPPRVDAEHDTGIEDADQRLEVAPPRCGEERIRDPALKPQVGVRRR